MGLNESHDKDINIVICRNIFVGITWSVAFSGMVWFISFNNTMRKYNIIAYHSFHAVDRPEDRPNTLLWLSIQAFTVNIFMGAYTNWSIYT